MAVQFASKMGFRVIAISRGSDKEKSARELGAHEYIDATVGDAGQKLADLGGAKLVLTTAQDAAAMTPLIKGISLLGKLLILSILQDGTLTLNSNELLPRGISVHCWPVASCHDCEETVNFAHLQGVHSTIEKFPLEKAQDAFSTYMLLFLFRKSN
jgi:D-arabinose 1-dehydrogenase-like Zn-dependent alcohol dehydrogenase